MEFYNFRAELNTLQSNDELTVYDIKGNNPKTAAMFDGAQVRMSHLDTFVARLTDVEFKDGCMYFNKLELDELELDEYKTLRRNFHECTRANNGSGFYHWGNKLEACNTLFLIRDHMRAFNPVFAK